MGDEAQKKAFNLAKEVREAMISVECDIVGRSLRAQMKYADKIGAKFSIVIGDTEIENNKAMLKNMETGEKKEVSLGENFLSEFFDCFVTYETTKLGGEEIISF